MFRPKSAADTQNGMSPHCLSRKSLHRENSAGVGGIARLADLVYVLVEPTGRQRLRTYREDNGIAAVHAGSDINNQIAGCRTRGNRYADGSAAVRVWRSHWRSARTSRAGPLPVRRFARSLDDSTAPRRV